MESALVSAAEDSGTSETGLSVSQRLLRIAEERKRWISKREETLMRKEKLLKLLQLHSLDVTKHDAHKGDKVPEEGKVLNKNEDKTTSLDNATLARKKELKELQTRAEVAKEKQQMAASVLAKNLKQLQAKRDRTISETDEQPRKKNRVASTDAGEKTVVAPTFRSFGAAPDLNIGTPELAECACFRIATRHLLQTGTLIPKEKLEQQFKAYTGKALDEIGDCPSLASSLCFNAEKYGETSPPSSSKKPVTWQPGRQFLKTATFISSDAEQIMSMIEVEKEVVAALCDTLQQSDTCKLKSSEIVKRRWQRSFLDIWLDNDCMKPTLSAFLSATVGVISEKPTSGNAFRIPNQPYGQMADVFIKMEKWLHEQAKTSYTRSSLSSKGNSFDGLPGIRSLSSANARPFSIANDSITKQLKRPETKKIDPKRILCHYELNGACNDEKCSNYHRKDYEEVENNVSYLTNDNNDARVVNMNGTDQLIQIFAEFRARIMKKWPVITTQTASVAAEKSKSGCTDILIEETPGQINATVPSSLRAGAQNDDITDDFLPLDEEEKPPEALDARYYDYLDSKKATGDMLQEKVKENPSDTNAWLLLAIYQLGLDVGVSDEVVNLSDTERLQQQLCRLSKELDTKFRSGGPRSLNVEETNLKRCLHTLSRALEIEANAYCESLWLLYLHLCRQVTSKQSEIDMVEQAVQFLPTSHALWLRYLSTFHFDSVGVAEGIYWGLLEHFAHGDSSESDSKPSRAKELSILLTAISFHLCIRLWAAGATSRVTRLVAALLQLGDTAPEYSWCGIVRGRLRSEELIVLCLTFAHILLFQELPGLIEHWVVSSSNESLPILEMTYSLEFFQNGDFHIDENRFDQVVAAYALAFQCLEKECSTKQDSGNAILTNWMLVLAFQVDGSRKSEVLQTFFKEKLDAIQQFPGASFIASILMQSTLSNEEAACQVMLTMMNQSSDDTFPEALHHYLFACRQFPSLVDALDKIFPSVMKRLASLVNVDINMIEKAIQDIMQDTSNVSKSCALKTVLNTLLAAWIDQLTVLRRLSPDQLMSQPMRSVANICVALDICHLMGILLQSSVAIDGLQTILCSSGFSILAYEARQLAWMQRFVFQVDLLQQEKVESTSWRMHQTNLSGLFRKYMAEMNVDAEVTRQVSTHIEHNLGKYDIESAVYACLYPERDHLITFNVNLQLFRLCANAIVEPEQTFFYASLTDSLALSPEFSLAFSDIAVHEWELLAARAGLRKCLNGAKTHHSHILQALVAVELRLRNMKAVSCLLESEIEANPLLLEAWRLVVGLEILFGATSETRARSIAEELEKRQLTFACNTFGDEKIINQDICWTKELEPASLNLRGLGLDRVPNAVLLKKELKSLDLSGNKLMDLPIGLHRLQNLHKLDVSENALVEFSLGLHGLNQLKELKLAHNNITTLPVLKLPSLSYLDIRWNAITSLPAPALLLSQTALNVLQAEENAIPMDELKKVYDFLSSRKDMNAQDSKKTLDDQTDDTCRGRTELRTANADSCETEMVQESGKLRPVAETTQSTNAENASTLDCAAKENDRNHMMSQRSADASSTCELNNENQIVIQESMNDSAASEPTVVIKDVGEPREVIELDNTESSESLDEETMNPVQAVAAVEEKTTSPDQVANLSISTTSEQPNQAEAQENVLDQNDVVTTLTRRGQSSHEEALVVQRKLAVYMDQSKIQSRAEVREQNPSLWRQFLVASVPLNLELPACRLCFAPNDGYNQRLNSTVLCLHCLEEALLVLKTQKTVENAQEEVDDST